MGPNLYLYVFNTFTMSVGSSVYISNLLSVSLCLILIQWLTSGANKQKIEIVMYLALTFAAGFITGSRTFLVILTLVTLVAIAANVKNNISFMSRFIYPAIFISLTLLVIFGTDNRLNSDGISSSRFVAWALAWEEYKLVELHEIVSLDEKYLISAFHNIILDAFYLYGERAYFLVLIYCIIIGSLIFSVTSLKSKLELRVAMLITILSSILIAFTSVIWRSDTNQLVILLGMTLLFTNKKIRAKYSSNDTILRIEK